MKKTLLTAILLGSTVAFAQTEAQPATAQPAAQQAPAKKAKKAKKSKKTSQTEQAAHRDVASADVQTATKSAVSPAPATMAAPVAATASPAQTSSASVAEVKAPAKKWGASARIYNTADYTDAQDVQTLTTIGASYQLTPKLKVKASQTFETLSSKMNNSLDSDSRAARKEITQANNFNATFADFTLSSSVPGVFGSQDIPVSLNYKNITGNAYYTQSGAYSGAHGFFEANASLPYSLNPKFDFGVDFQWRHVISRAGPSANSNRFLAIPSITYNISDMVNVYQSAGMILSMRDNNELRRRYERVYLETGVNVTPIKQLSLNFNVNQDKAVYVRDGEADRVSSFSLYSPTEATNGNTFDAVAFEATATLSF